ncbi:MAG TPA: hypothetical protein VHS33_02705 [Sphingomicrobium sp.]|jgi:hypothetical protein|nr:hypothetical protein [Sphingomicrobium sp.]
MPNRNAVTPEARAEIERIGGRIQRLVASRFEHEDTYYLSQLGNELGEDRKLFESLTGRKLSEFLSSEVGFQLDRTGVHKNVLFIRRPGSASPPPPAKPRFRRAFWLAFAAPLEAGSERHINIDTLKWAADADYVTEGGGEVRPIAAKFIAKDAEASDADIISQIEKWLQEQNLEEDRFHVQKRRSERHGERSLLDVVLIALSADQLKRVSLPLDVVKSLSEQRTV